MRVLQLCHKIPYPPSDGGSIAMHQITRGLLDKGIHVKVLALAPGRGLSPRPEPGVDYVQETGFESFPVNTSIRPIPAFVNLFTKGSYNVSRFYSRPFARRLAELLKKETFDIIQLEGLYLTPYIPVIRDHTGSTLLFRSHNIEHYIWARMARVATNPLKKAYLKFLANRLKAYEMETIHQVDGLVAISSLDQRFFEKNGFAQPAITIPVAANPAFYKDAPKKVEPGSVFHLGSMDWRPNMEGLGWFLENVWPLVQEKNPHLRFFLAGKNIPPSFNQYQGQQIIIDGEVDDAADYMASRELMVVPLRSGGGMRVKIIEGMAAGKAIVSTSIGAEGIQCTHGENIILADTPSEMAASVLSCFEDRTIMERTGAAARQFALDHHNIDPMMDTLIAFYISYLKETRDE